MSRVDPLHELERLIAEPTIAGRPNRQLIDHVAERLSGLGARCTVVSSDSRPDGFNLLATVGPAQGRGILLAAHTDVVDVEGQRWSGDPFTLRRDGDRLYGRGTADMKGFIAAVLAVVAELAGRRLRRPLQIALSCDEELGCLGVGSMLDLLAESPERPLLCIVGEPTRMRVADRHKGKVRLVADVRGRALHSAAAPRAVNAVTYAARLIASLDELGRGLAESPQQPGFDVPHATLSIGPIHGGVSTNIVPDACSFEFELRYLPGQDVDAILAQALGRARRLQAEMREVAPEAGIELRTVAAYPPLTPAAQGPSLPGEQRSQPRLAVDFGTEAGLYQERLGVPVLICGPGDMADAHRADEYVELGQLQEAQRFLLRITEQL